MRPPVPIQFRIQIDDPFQAKLEEAIKGMRHGARNLFLVNLCRALFTGMEGSEIQEFMKAISYSKTDSLEELFSRALHRFEAGRSFQMMKEVEVKPLPEEFQPPPPKKRHEEGSSSLKALIIGDT
jgi:hypothetical protein